MKIVVTGAVALAALALAALPGTAAVAAPRPSNPVGATVTLAATTVKAGEKIRFTGTGWANAGGTGQTVTIKLDDVDILGEVTASDAGAISGAVTIPKSIKAGNQHWLRLLAGSKAGDTPSRSLASGYFAVTAAAGGATTGTGANTGTGTTGPGATGTGAGTTGTGAGTTGTTGAGTTGTTGAGTLPKTGIDAGPWLAGAVALPAAGVALLLIERRRRRLHASS